MIGKGIEIQSIEWNSLIWNLELKIIKLYSISHSRRFAAAIPDSRF